MPRPPQSIADGLAYHVITNPVIQDGKHLLPVLCYIEANHLRAGLVARAGDILKGS